MNIPIFVFFTINRSNIGKSWPIWGKYPDGWTLSGSGRISPICSDGNIPIYKYELRDQYNGSNSNMYEMKVKIHKYYGYLLKKNYIVDYVIAESFSEIDNYRIN